MAGRSVCAWGGQVGDLLIDLGNSQAKLGWLAGETMRILGTAASGEELAGLVSQPPSRIWLCSVVENERKEAFLADAGLSGANVNEITVAGYLRHQPSHYAPDQLGVDRWLGVLACRERGLSPAVVVDTGTATTVDLLDAGGMHLGGYILPGLEAMHQALSVSTALPVRSDGPCGEPAVPATTAEAIACGALYAQVGAIERAFARLGSGCHLVLSGGAAHRLMPHLSHEVVRIEQLVLEGLAVLARKEGACVG
ncbi:MAG: type III pantothenate kinase [Gammaproteobacteria bacterium]|nr:MAG: type III pantothenate kinase [Gammaproteobacteria bacterium]